METDPANRPIEDEFRADDVALVESAKALIHLSDRNALVPHGLGGHARKLIAALLLRLELANQKVEGFVITNGRDDEYRTLDADGLPIWTQNINDAIRFSRRVDAEMFCREDEDAWHIRHVATNPDRGAFIVKPYEPAVPQT